MKSIKIEIYSAEIKLFFSSQEMNKWLKKNTCQETQDYLITMSDSSDGMAGVVQTTDGKCYYFIMLEKMDVVTLCHECVHIAYMMLSAIGVHHDVENHEAFAYLTHHVFEKAGLAFGLFNSN